MLLSLLATLLVPAAAAPPSPLADPGFLGQFAATHRFRAGTPVGIQVLPDGKTLLFLRSGPRSVVQDLWEHDIATGQERVLLTAEQVLGGGQEVLSPEELARRERLRESSRGVVSYSLTEDARQILVPLSGRLFVVDRATGLSRELGSEQGFPLDARFSEDGARIGLVREGDFYVIDTASGKERRLTTRTSEHVENGVAEFVAQEELDRREGWWWSPDASFIVYAQVDTSGLETFTIADPKHPEAPAQTWPYPRPGRRNAEVKLGVLPVQGGETTWIDWDRARYPYVVSVRWPKRAPLTLVVANRPQTEFAVLAVDPQKGTTRILLTEQDDAWVENHPAVPSWSADGSEFLWISEGSGAAELQRRAGDGKLLGVVAGREIGFRDLLHHDEEARTVLVSGAVDPTENHVFALSIGGRKQLVRPLSVGRGVHGVVAAKSGLAKVLSASLEDGSRHWFVKDSRGKPRGELRSVAEAPPFVPRIEWTEIEAEGHRFYAQILRPRDFDNSRRYPVIHSVYAGPTAQVVTRASFGSLLNQWFADHGFIVVAIDNRGTPGRDRAWSRAWKTEDPTGRGDLIDVALHDQAAAIAKLAARYPEMDGERIGVYGWSFGGYFSAMAAMRRPEVWKAACAGAPVCSWEDYDTAYTERYLGTPQDNPEGYRRSDVLTYAADLTVPLLLVHGTADDNVYFMHSLKMADTMFRAGRDFDFLVLPGFTHMVPDPVVTRSLYSRIARFFEAALKPGT